MSTRVGDADVAPQLQVTVEKTVQHDVEGPDPSSSSARSHSQRENAIELQLAKSKSPEAAYLPDER